MAAAVAAEALRMRLAPACRRICTAAAGAASAAGAAAGKKTTPASAGGAAKNSTRTTVGSAAAGKAPGAAGGGPEKKKKKLVVLLSTAAKGTGLGHHGSAAGKRAYSSGNGNGGVNTKTAPTAAGNGNGSNGVNTKTAPTAAGNATPPSCGGSQPQQHLHELRKEILANQRELWDKHNWLVSQDRLTRKEVAELRAEVAAQEMEAANTEMSISLKVVLVGGALIWGAWFGFKDMIKNKWEKDALHAFEQKMAAAASAGAPSCSSTST